MICLDCGHEPCDACGGKVCDIMLYGSELPGHAPEHCNSCPHLCPCMERGHCRYLGPT